MSLGFFLYKLAGSLIVPPGLFILAAAALAAQNLRRRESRAAGFLALFLAVGLFLFSTPAGARFLAGDLEEVKASLPKAGEKAALLVLGGGVRYGGAFSGDEPGPLTTLRILSAFEISRKHPWPVIVTGGSPWRAGGATTSEIMAGKLRDLGYSGPLLLVSRSRTTREDLAQAREVLRAKGIRQAVLVTNAFHMKRALWIASQVMPEVLVYPFPAGHLLDRVPLQPADFLPAPEMAGYLAFREKVALAAERLMAPFR